MDILTNIDLFFIGLAVLMSLILGTVVFLSDPRSITNRSFLFFIIVTSIWGVLNYISYHVFLPKIGFWVIRAVMLFALWQAFAIFQFFLVFPETRYKFPKIYRFFLIPITLVVSVLILTPLVFKRASEISSTGVILKIENGPLISLFGLVAGGLVVAGIILFIRKILIIKEKQKKLTLLLVLLGTSLTFLLILTFNFVLPAFFANSKFVVYGLMFFFPFIIFTSYSIFKHHLFNIKVISTEILVFILAVPVLIEFVSMETSIIRLYKGFVFLLVLNSGLLLIQSVRKEVLQREKLEVLTNQLQAANTQLKELDKQKTDFLSFAAHQLRTPLSILNGYIELLTDDGYGKIPAEAKGILKNMDESNGHLVKLVDNFLDITRMEQGRTKYDFVLKDLNAIVTEAVKELDERAAGKGLALIWEPQKGLPQTYVDEEKVRNVAFNFIDNAIKYSEQGEIGVQVYQERDGLAMRVKDNGRGFEKIDEVSFFQKFYRGQNVQGINVNGTGLGLYVCRIFIEAHRGKVWAHSDGIGKGSEFGFWIPIISAAPVATESSSSTPTLTTV